MPIATMQKRKRVDLSNTPSKKRKRTFGIEEITYDANAREDFLTGFHKRKLQRAKHAREAAAKKEKAERIEARKNVSQTLTTVLGMGLMGHNSYGRRAKRTWKSTSHK